MHSAARSGIRYRAPPALDLRHRVDPRLVLHGTPSMRARRDHCRLRRYPGHQPHARSRRGSALKAEARKSKARPGACAFASYLSACAWIALESIAFEDVQSLRRPDALEPLL